MTIEVVQGRLDSLLEATTPRIVLLTGGWGAGKTHQWKQALQRAANARNSPPYAYVSLFGLTSLAEVRKRAAEEIVATLRLPGDRETVGEAIGGGGWRLKPVQIMKLFPVIPYLGKLEGLANELSFLSVRNAVVCFDDLERGGKDLRLADVFGLASFLKEERNCKVVLISNHDKLRDDSKDELMLYLEKVVDEAVHFAPTTEEACDIALGKTPDPPRAQLRERMRALGISNIRVVSRLSSMALELASVVDGMNEQVLHEGIQALALFGAAHFLPTDGFPPFDYIMGLEEGWGKYLTSAKKLEAQTDEDRKMAAWVAMLDRYGYVVTSPFDAEIGRSVRVGYFSRDALAALAQDRSTAFDSASLQAEYNGSWTKFWHSLDGRGDELLATLREVTSRAIPVLGLTEMNRAYEVFVQAGQPEVADALFSRFVECNQHRPKVFEQVDGVFRDQFGGLFAQRIRVECAALKPPPSLEDALDRIDVQSGWNPEDVQIVSKANVEEIEQMLRKVEGRQFRSRLRTLLHIGTLSDASDDAKRVSHETVELLKRLAAEDQPLGAIRWRQYIPAESSSENQG